MFKLVVSNRKGGSAKTTTAVNLAGEFAQQGKRCLLIDLDPQAHAGMGLGYQPLQNDACPQNLLENGRQSLASLLFETRIDNLFYLPPGERRNKPMDATRLYKFLCRKQLAETFEIVVIDTPPNAGIEQTAALKSADAVVIPFMPTPLGKAGVQQMTADISQLKTFHGKRLPYALIPIMLDTRVRLDNQVLSDLIAIHGLERILRGIRRNVKVAEAFEAGCPVRHYDGRSQGAFDYHMLSQDMLALWPGLFPLQDSLSLRKPAARVIPVNRQALEENLRHRGIRLKDKCQQWNG